MMPIKRVRRLASIGAVPGLNHATAGMCIESNPFAKSPAERFAL